MKQGWHFHNQIAFLLLISRINDSDWITLKCLMMIHHNFTSLCVADRIKSNECFSLIGKLKSTPTSSDLMIAVWISGGFCNDQYFKQIRFSSSSTVVSTSSYWKTDFVRITNLRENMKLVLRGIHWQRRKVSQSTKHIQHDNFYRKFLDETSSWNIDADVSVMSNLWFVSFFNVMDIYYYRAWEITENCVVTLSFY